VIAQEELALQCLNVRKTFGSIEVLKGLNLRVSRGERIALLGPNGAGKTTLVRAICGRVTLSQGKIELFGQAAGSSLASKKLGVVPQEIALYGDLTAKENLEIFAKLHGLGRREGRRRVEEVLEWIGLRDRADQLLKSFSGGMKRRVNLACGILHKPPLILLDEPTVGVDPQSRQRIFEMLDELNQQGAAIVLTTHHLEEAEQQSERIVIMDHGKVIAEGALNDLIEQTIGHRRQLVMQVERAGHDLGSSVEAAVLGDRLTVVEAEALQGFQFASQVNAWSTEVRDVARELPPMIAKLNNSGLKIADLEIRSPNLHHVFIHLTGRELRE
jgi:ABC-2 type transport system ATP-binding protein